MTEMACGRKDDQIKFNVELSGGEKTHLLLAHGRDDGDQQIFAVFEARGDLVTHFTLGDFDIILGGTILSHQVEEAVIDVDLRQEDQYLNRENNPKKLTSWYSSRLTLGTSMLWVEGEISSYRR